MIKQQNTLKNILLLVIKCNFVGGTKKKSQGGCHISLKNGGGTCWISTVVMVTAQLASHALLDTHKYCSTKVAVLPQGICVI